MRILVTGAAGFLGSALLRALASRAPDDEIVALDLASSPDARVAARVTWLSGALDDRDTIERARLQDVDVVYHLASLPGALAERQPALGRRVNLDATLDLFDRLAGSGRRPRVVYANVLARLFSGKMLAMLTDAHDAGQLTFFNAHAGLSDKKTFKRFIAPLRRIKWVVYCKAPFAGPKQVLRYLSHYTHRVAISNRRLIAVDDAGVAFRWKDYRIDGRRPATRQSGGVAGRLPA